MKVALGQFDLGPAAAMSIIYFLGPTALLGLYTLMIVTRPTDEENNLVNSHSLHHFFDVADLLARQHVI